jgi:WD40 repeat protein
VGQKLWIPARPLAYGLPTVQAQDVLTPVAELSALSPSALAFSPDGRRLAIGLGQERTFEWQLWDVEQGTLLVRIPGHTSAIKFSHDGRYIAAAGDVVKVW